MPRIKIPDALADRIIQQYIDGKSTREIANILNISKSSVSKVINGDPHYFEIREKHVLAVNLRKDGLDVKKYAPLIRAGNLLISHGVEQTMVEEYMIRLISACYDLNLTPEQLVNFLFDFKAICAYVHWSPKVMQKFVDNKLKMLYCVNRQILEESKTLVQIKADVQGEKVKLLEDYPHYAVHLELKDQEIEKLKSRIKQMESERAPLACPFCMEHVDPMKLTELHDIVGVTVTSEELVRKAQQVIEDPQKYAFLFLPKVRVDADNNPEPILTNVIN